MNGYTRYYCMLTDAKAKALNLEHNYVTFTDNAETDRSFVRRGEIILDSDIVIATHSSGYHFCYKNIFDKKCIAVKIDDLTLFKLSSVELTLNG